LREVNQVEKNQILKIEIIIAINENEEVSINFIREGFEHQMEW
jgi:hypothetical protein